MRAELIGRAALASDIDVRLDTIERSHARYLLIETSVPAETLAADVHRVLTELERIRTTRVDAEALGGVKARAVAELANQLASGAKLADYLAREYLGEIPPLAVTLKQLDAITPNEIQRELERKGLMDPLGPAYEFDAERRVARMFGPRDAHREGEEWEIDLELAAALLSHVGDLEPPLQVSGRAAFAAMDDIAGVPVQRIEAWARAEGTLKVELTYKTRARNATMELKYSGAFPVNLNLPPLEHDWTFTGKAELIVEIHDRLGEVRIDTVSRHQSRITQITR